VVALGGVGAYIFYKKRSRNEEEQEEEATA
jgi:hypothetical protein